MITTYSYRIKDKSAGKHLDRMARDVNFVWNYCNDVIRRRWKESRKYTSRYDLQKLTRGGYTDLSINAQTIQVICKEITLRVSKVRGRVKFRSRGKSLGWVPFTNQRFRLQNDTCTYSSLVFKFWSSRSLPDDAVIKCGSFNCNASGQWFVNVTFESNSPGLPTALVPDVGVDLGLRTQITCSDDTKYERPNLTKKYEERLAKAQRAGKKRRTKKIHLNIKNTRSDWNHKASNEIASKYSVIFVGSVSPSRLIKTKACGMAKSVNDAGWFQFKTFLKYKAIKHSGSMYEINENYSTVTCSTCSSRTGPSGLSDLGVRVWECSSCNSVHDRDTNAALNILRSGRGTLKEEAAW